MKFLPYAIAAWLFVIGLYGLATSRHLVHLILCLTVVQSSTYLVLLAIGFRNMPAQAPIFTDVPPGSPAVDPIVHSLTLTDIVVGATVNALLLSLTLNIWRKHRSIDPEKLSAFPR